MAVLSQRMGTCPSKLWAIRPPPDDRSPLEDKANVSVIMQVFNLESTADPGPIRGDIVGVLRAVKVVPREWNTGV
jgi:hypothetical protein